MSATGTDHDTHVDDPSNGGSSQANPAKAAKRAEAKDTHSWHVLLGPNLDGKLLCVDSTPGEHGDFFSQLGAIVHTLDLGAPGGHLSPDLWLKRLANHLETDWASAPDAAQFDGFIFHDLAARVLRVGDAELISRLLRAVHRLLKPGGFCYVGFLNSRALFRRTPAGNAGLGPATIRRAFRDAGFAAANFRLHPYLLERDSVLEILPVRGYTSVKNSRLTSERVKEWCYGRFGSQRWAPGYGAVAFKDQAPCSVVDMLARELEKLPEARGGALHMLRAQVLRRKIIFSFGRGDEKYGQLVVVYSRDPQSIDRRAAESAILLRLVKRMPALRDSVPRFVSQGAIGRYQYFALTEFAGMTIDRPSAGTEVAKRNAVAWLSNFHRTTIEWNASPAGELNEVATSFFEQAIGRYPSLRTEIEAVASALRKHAIATELKWPSVWQHGDFKLENLILDPATYSIVGVIDWELSCERGLPLLDLLYLIVYDRGVNEGLKLEDVYLMEILEWKFSARDNALLDEYLRTVGMTVTDAKIWAATYLIHDIGIRRFYSVSDPQHVSILKKMLSKTADALASPQSGAAAELRGAPAAGTST